MEKANWWRSDKVKWDSSSSSTKMSLERDKTSSGHAWPQRNYSCAFCKKQFKSAQALGGHMNIHRRERAQLRSSLVLSPPNPTLDFPYDPNPNPTPKKASFLVPYASYHSSLCSLSSSKSSSTCMEEEKMQLKAPQSTRVDDHRKKIMRHGELHGFGNLNNFMAQEDENEFGVLKKKEKIGSLEMGIGLVRDIGKEDLDLELRLGFS